MSIILALYLADVCEGLFCFFLGLGFVFMALSVVCGIGVYVMDYGEEVDKKIAGLVYTVVACIISFFITVFIPSKTTMLAYTGISISKELKAEVQTSETYQKLMKVLNIKLDDYIAEKEKKKKKNDRNN